MGRAWQASATNSRTKAPPPRATRSKSVKETEMALEKAFEQLKSEREIRATHETRLNYLEEKTANESEELKTHREELGEARHALADISKKLDNRQRRKDELEK